MTDAGSNPYMYTRRYNKDDNENRSMLYENINTSESSFPPTTGDGLGLGPHMDIGGVSDERGLYQKCDFPLSRTQSCV